MILMALYATIITYFFVYRVAKKFDPQMKYKEIKFGILVMVQVASLYAYSMTASDVHYQKMVMYFGIFITLVTYLLLFVVFTGKNK